MLALFPQLHTRRNGPQHFVQEFFVSRQPDDTLYLHSSGVVGTYTLWLNGTLMDKGVGMGLPHTWTLPPTQQHWQWNRLELEVLPLGLPAAHAPWLPIGAVGVYGLQLVASAPAPATSAAVLPVGAADTVMVWLPLQDGQLASLSHSRQQLQTMRGQGFRHVYMPIALPQPYQALLQAYQLRPVSLAGSAAAPSQLLGWQAYAVPDPLACLWWHHADGTRTAAYGMRHGLFAQHLATEHPAPAKWSLLLILVLVLLSVLAWKLQSPRGFREAMQLGNVRGRFGELSRELNFFQKSENPRMPQFARLLLLSCLLSGLFLYLYVTQGSESLHVFAAGGLLHWGIQALGSSPLLLFLFVWLAVLALWAVRQGLLAFTGALYGVRNLAGKVGGVELAGVYPQLLALAVLPYLLLLAHARLQPVVLVLLAALGLFHVLRRLLVLLAGLQQVLHMPTSLIILYICLLEILPWLLLL
jgi:hypothetical protein